MNTSNARFTAFPEEGRVDPDACSFPFQYIFQPSRLITFYLPLFTQIRPPSISSSPETLQSSSLPTVSEILKHKPGIPLTRSRYSLRHRILCNRARHSRSGNQASCTDPRSSQRFDRSCSKTQCPLLRRTSQEVRKAISTVRTTLTTFSCLSLEILLGR